jgi:GH25 family lysozyme M1 (1,4-beta-N-acetylmuramidase)
MFPCYSQQKTPESQVDEMVKQLGGTHYSSIWIDMETNPSTGCGWSTDFDANCAFTERVINSAKKSGKTVGIYASNYMWGQIMGGSDRCPKFTTLPIWYAHYDNIPDFSDWKPFGGWTKPTIKQYKGTTAVCGASIDLNYKP